MSNRNPQEIIKLLVCIVDRGKGVRLVDLFKAQNLHFDFICLGLGTANSEILDYFGLGETTKDIVFAMIPAGKAAKVIRLANERFHFSSPGKGIVFTIPLSGVSGRVPQVLCKPEYLETEGEVEKMDSRTQFDLILTILNRGFSDKVMEAAKHAGAKGGTVLHARRVGFEDVQNFLGFTIQPEKEIVAILAPREIKHDIMVAINEKAGISTECRGILLSLPVDEIMGI